MTAKEFKQYQNLRFFFEAEAIEDEGSYCAALSDALALDYSHAVSMWEFVLSDRSDIVSAGGEGAELYTDKTAAVFIEKDAQRFAKLVFDNAAVRSAVYRSGFHTFTSRPLINILASAMLSNKLDAADEIIRCASKNSSTVSSYPEFLNEAVDIVIAALREKNAQPLISRKLAAYILAHAEKLKGAEKPLITQKIKELT